MVWRRLLLIAAILLPAMPAAFTAMSCGDVEANISGCINGDGVDITGTTGGPGDPPGGGGGGTGTTGTAGGPPVIWKCLETTCTKDSPGSEPITLSDIVTFHPTPTAQRMQPDGWTVPGLNTNIYAVTSTHVVHGTLLGQPAAVRFTPVAFHWVYGDGQSATRTTKGGTWNALGVREFDRTPTSHVYANEGRYTIRLVVDFAAEYQFAGSPFYPIAGVIPVPANDLHIVADGAKTVLVERDCATDPEGPGC